MRHKALVGALFLGNLILTVASAQTAEDSSGAMCLTKINIVDFARPEESWSTANVGQPLAVHDRLRTGEDSRATTRLSDLSVLHVDELATIEILPPKKSGAKATLNLKQGSLYFFNNGKSREMDFQTPAANGAIRGTEFLMSVGAKGGTVVTMLSGKFALSNALGGVLVGEGEQAQAEPGVKPTKKKINQATGQGSDSPPSHLLIEAKLPNILLTTASKTQFLSALRAAVSQWRNVAVLIVQAAAKARPEWTEDILKEAINALGEPRDPQLISEIVSALIALEPDQASQILEWALEFAPGYTGALEGLSGEGDFDNPIVRVPPPEFMGGAHGGGNACVVCHNGQNIPIGCNELIIYLAAHPGDTIGPCQVTTVTNR